MSQLEFEVKSISVVLKLSEICNLACSYCYYYEADHEKAWEKRPRFINEDVVVQLVTRLEHFIRKSGTQVLKLVLHGGEPTLLSPEVADFVCRHTKAKLGQLVDIRFSLQTNGYFISKEWIALIRRHRIEVGISVDGEPAVHDKFRITVSGKPSSVGIRTSAAKLLSADFNDDPISVGVIAVVDQDAEITQIVDYVENTLKIDGINFLLRCPTTPENGQIDCENSARFAKVLKDIFKAHLLSKGIYCHELQSLLMAIRGQPRYRQRQQTALNSYPSISLSVHTDGTFGIDDSLITVGDWYKNLQKFNVNTDSIDNLLCNADVLAYHDAYFRIPDDCMNCKFSTSCGGGLPHFRYTQERGFNNKSMFCQSYFEFYEFVANELIEAGFPAGRLWQAISNH